MYRYTYNLRGLYETPTLAEEPAHRDEAHPEQSFQLIWPYTDLLLHDMGEGLADLPTGAFLEAPWGDEEGPGVVVCRTGYTGEHGYELLPPWDQAAVVFDALVDAVGSAGGELAGLGARDTLRTEMGYPLHGQDLSREITPVMARLGWAVGWDKPEFWGRDALLAQRAAKEVPLLRGLVASGRGIPRPGMAVAADGSEVGRVTSGTFSPTLRKGVALALLDRSVGLGDEVTVDVRGRTEAFVVTAPPFVPSSTR